MKRYLHNGYISGCYEVLELEGKWYNETEGVFETENGRRWHGTFLTAKDAQEDFERKMHHRVLETKEARELAQRKLRYAVEFHDEAVEAFMKAMTTPTFIKSWRGP